MSKKIENVDQRCETCWSNGFSVFAFFGIIKFLKLTMLNGIEIGRDII